MNQTSDTKNLADAKLSAEEVGLKYVSDQALGINRAKNGKVFYYVDAQGKRIRDHKILDRINALAIPPAYKNVWICANANGHLQATGMDARGRKQYRYHAKWRQIRDQTKYDRMLLFGQALPKIRTRVTRDLAAEGLPKDKVLALIVSLIEKTFIRVGNEEYAKENNSYGLTTMHDKHVTVSAGEIKFVFKGKSGVKHSVDVTNKKLARIVKKCQDLPGQELFQYKDDNGTVHDISSSDVNEYLKSITGEEFTAKDFRTWHGTVLAVRQLRHCSPSETVKQTKKNLVGAIEWVADHLGNTQAICRKCYIHPSVISSYMDGTFQKKFAMKNDESAVLAFLKKNLK